MTLELRSEEPLFQFRRTAVEEGEVAGLGFAAADVEETAEPPGKGPLAPRGEQRRRTRPQTAEPPGEFVHLRGEGHSEITFVAAEKLVRAVAGKGDRDLLAGESAQQRRGQNGAVGVGFAAVAHQLHHQRKVGSFHLALVEAQIAPRDGAQMGRPLAGERPLIVGAFLESHGVGVAGRLLEQTRRDARDDVGVDAAGEEDPHGDVGHEPFFHRLFDQTPELFCQFLPAPRGAAGKVDLPVRAESQAIVFGLEKKRVGRGKLENFPEDAPVGGNVLKRKVEAQGVAVQRFGEFRMAPQRAQFTRENKVVPVSEVAERLLAHPVPAHEADFPAAVPQGEGEHPLQTGDAIRPLLFVKMQNHLGIGSRGEDVPLCLQLLAQVKIVVDLAVDHQHDPAVFGIEGLIPRLQIDDRKAAVAQQNAGPRKEAVTVRPPVGHGPAEGVEKVFFFPFVGSVDDARYAAHDGFPLF